MHVFKRCTTSTYNFNISITTKAIVLKLEIISHQDRRIQLIVHLSSFFLRSISCIRLPNLENIDTPPLSKLSADLVLVVFWPTTVRPSFLAFKIKLYDFLDTV